MPRAPRPAAGSSPRVRGTRTSHTSDSSARRFIPACAGNSSGRGKSRRRRAVHPRVCGELRVQVGQRGGNVGSSPRVRGTLPAFRLRATSRRFIPACAGNSSAVSAFHSARSGSSPRVRGTRVVVVAHPDRVRFIPACAGNSRWRRWGVVRCHGSSPRVRGTQTLGAGQGGRIRFIPACAGNSTATTSGRNPTPVHPRVCGELPDSGRFSPKGYGSSPRVRGTQYRGRDGGGRRRFIPACAGNSGSTARLCIPPPVHPRVCGELSPQRVNPRREFGSSPRVRGTHQVSGISTTILSVHPRVCGELVETTQTPVAVPRFIPACAGNSTRSTCSATLSTVHPRVCGELLMRLADIPCVSGSSPRVRGTRSNGLPRAALVRFIPACAGNSRPPPRFPRRRSVHPRVCGELRRAWRGTRVQIGSSPRVRGTLEEPHALGVERRFIPACAGNSRPRGRTARSSAVHPRVCGELSFRAASANASSGSSPRVRGTRSESPRPSWSRRFIPACAGNSVRGVSAGHASAVHPRVCGELP